MLGIPPFNALIQGVFRASGNSGPGGTLFILPAYFMRLFAHKELAEEREPGFTPSLVCNLALGKVAQAAAKALFLEEEFKALAYQVDVSVAALRLMREMERLSQSINNIFHVALYGSSFERVTDKMLGVESPSLLSPQNLQTLKSRTWRLLLALGNLHLAGEGQTSQLFLFRNFYYLLHLLNQQDPRMDAFVEEVGGKPQNLRKGFCQIEGAKVEEPSSAGGFLPFLGGGSSNLAIKEKEPLALSW